MKNLLEGKTILITGSSRGIGAETAKLAKGYGAEVILHGRTESLQLKQVAKSLNSKFIVCDVADEKQVKEKVKSLGKIDILVNCAGVVGGNEFSNLTRKDWEEVFNVNLFGTAYFCQAVAPTMLKNKWGRIVNISSVRGLNLGRPFIMPYNASKAAIINFTQTLARVLAPNVTVNAIAPGPTDTESLKSAGKELLEEFIDHTLIKRLIPVEDIAEAILFLASDKASSITGQTIVVDGGNTIWQQS